MRDYRISALAICLSIVLLFGAASFAICLHTEIHTMTVKEKMRAPEKDGGKYRIFGDREVYEVTDSVLFWRFNSSDCYNSLDVGKTYRIKVQGLRVPFFSWYRNILSVEPMEVKP